MRRCGVYYRYMTNEERIQMSEKATRIRRSIRRENPDLFATLPAQWAWASERADNSGGRFRVGTMDEWLVENFDGYDPEGWNPPAEALDPDREPAFEDDDSYWEDNDDFPLYMEYDEGMDDMYADGDGFYTNDPGDW